MVHLKHPPASYFILILSLAALNVGGMNLNAAESLAESGDATELKACTKASFKVSNDKTIYFWLHLFGDGTRDLALANLPSTKPLASKSAIKRVTYNKSNRKTCPYQALAITEGLGWGWHLAWADSAKLYIARMDGEAWVSSVPKKIAADNIIRLQFNQNGYSLSLQWKTAEGITHQVHSYDDGRSWSTPGIETKSIEPRP